MNPYARFGACVLVGPLTIASCLVEFVRTVSRWPWWAQRLLVAGLVAWLMAWYVVAALAFGPELVYVPHGATSAPIGQPADAAVVDSYRCPPDAHVEAGVCRR